jgi:hypothetical protein
VPIEINTVDKFLRIYVEKSDSCWQWTGAKNHVNGYGKCRFQSKHTLPHRVFYNHYKGKIPKGYQIDHLCENKLCVNPDHLEAVTPRTNTLRSERAPAAINFRKTHCKRNHELFGENLYITPDNRRQCKTCNSIRGRRYVSNRT